MRERARGRGAGSERRGKSKMAKKEPREWDRREPWGYLLPRGLRLRVAARARVYDPYVRASGGASHECRSVSKMTQAL